MPSPLTPACPKCRKPARYIGIGHFNMLHCDHCTVSDGVPRHVDREKTEPMHRIALPPCTHGGKFYERDGRLHCEACGEDLGTVFDYIGVL